MLYTYMECGDPHERVSGGSLLEDLSPDWLELCCVVCT